MININEIYETVQGMAQKAKHGAIRVSDFNKYANLASIDYFNEKIGAVRDYYRLGKAIAKSGVGMNKDIEQSLRPYLVDALSVTVIGSKGTIPADCEYIDNVMYGTKPVKWVPYNKIASYLNSTIDVPTLDYPIYSDLATQLLIYPQLSPALLTYYKTPETVIWNYTLVDNKPVYSASGSVNYSWYPTEKLQLIMRILNYVGITIRDTELVQYGITETNTVA